MSNGIFKIINFQTQAFVIVEGKREADAFYIVRQGQVRVANEIPIPGEEPYQILGPGDFFGVVSCMSGHPHMETAQTLAATSFIVVRREQFAALIQKNAPIAMKIIRHFSKQLRTIDQAITKLSFHQASEENTQLMYEVGEYYYEKAEMGHAAYAYQRYIEHVPNGPNVAESKARLQAINAPLAPPPAQRQGLNRLFKDQEMIFIEHEPGAELYIIQQGKVKITKVVDKDEVLLAVLQPGDIFGEMALLENKPRSASASAHGNVNTLAINKTNFEVMVKAQPQLAVKLINILSERIWTAYRQLSNLLIEDPMGRLYDMLLTLALKKKIPIEHKASHVFDINPQELIKMLGYSGQKGESLIMTFLEDKNFKLEAGKLVCSDLLEIEKQVQFYKKKIAMDKKREAAKNK
ncbi:MAG: cyclic nucleotide-binding domain-containing protein [Spirochaetia bacterium]|nr:cyclic nucleotide-binding domain-containing protein [Spirochaetia bacterium]